MKSKHTLCLTYTHTKEIYKTDLKFQSYAPKMSKRPAGSNDTDFDASETKIQRRQSDISKLYRDAIEQILSKFDSKYLILNLRLVCMKWKNLIEDIVRWRNAHHLQGRYGPDLHPLTYYSLEILHKNLLCDPQLSVDDPQPFGPETLPKSIPIEVMHLKWSYENEFKRETPSTEGGAKVKAIPLHILKENGFSGPDEFQAIATSCSLMTQYQDIVLRKIGISDELMDKIKPTIIAEEWVGTRYDCGSEYIMIVQLFSETIDYMGKPVMISEKRCEVRTMEQKDGNEDGSWRKVSISIKGYEKGVRRIRFIRRGQDSNVWAGFYGAKLAMPKVYLKMPLLLPTA